MKSMILLIGLWVFGPLSVSVVPLDKESEKVAAVIKQFVKSADKRDVSQMESILHKDYRTVANRLFGSEAVSIMDKSSYLNLLKEGKIGGDSRKVEIEQIDIEGNNAIVKATFRGKELNFYSYLQLVKQVDGAWKLISDFPKIEKV